MATKPSLFFQHETVTQGSYTNTRIRLFETDQVDAIPNLMAECVRDRSEYGSPETADKLLARYSELHRAGFAGIVQTSWAPWVTLDWQHYIPTDKPAAELQYCELQVDLPHRVSDLSASFRLWDRIRATLVKVSDGAAYVEMTPVHALRALAKHRATQCFRVCSETGWWSAYATLAPGRTPTLEANARAEYSLTL